MKQYLLLLPMMCLTATTSMAQNSYDTAIEAKIGENDGFAIRRDGRVAHPQWGLLCLGRLRWK